MIRTSVFVGVSLDGFLARLDDSLDWLSGGEAEPHGFEEFFATVDALLMGRRTYDVVLGLEPWYYGDTPLFVLSSKPLAPAPAGRRVERITGEPDEVLAQLEAQGIKHVYVDGGLTIQSFLRAGRIDRMTISTLPILIGTGIPLLGPTGRDIPLRHVATRTFKGGLVQSEYEVTRTPEK
jgi:dihydrofolate reductase